MSQNFRAPEIVPFFDSGTSVVTNTLADAILFKNFTFHIELTQKTLTLIVVELFLADHQLHISQGSKQISTQTFKVLLNLLQTKYPAPKASIQNKWCPSKLRNYILEELLHLLVMFREEFDQLMQIEIDNNQVDKLIEVLNSINTSINNKKVFVSSR